MQRLLCALVLVAACEGSIAIVDDTDADTDADTDTDTDSDTDTDTDSDTDSDTLDDARPVADAGGDLTVYVGERALLDGSGSYDPQGDPLQFQWTLEEQPGASWAVLVDPRSEVASLTPDAPGSWRVKLRVDDGASISEPDHATLTAVVPPFDGETFDPDQVWLLGTVSEGLCGREIIADPRRPDRGAVGFDCSASGHVVHPDGRVVYSASYDQPPAVFNCDGDCIITQGADYPAGPNQDNDPLLAVPCKPEVDPVQRWTIGPDDAAFQCTREVGTGTWLGERGEVAFELPETARSLRLGTDGAVLYTTDGRTYSVLDRDDDSHVSVSGLPEDTPIAIRSRPGGAFWMALPVRDDSDTEVALWEVAADGSATKVGDYPPSPEGCWAPTLRRGQLDAKGALWQQGRGTRETFEDVIIRRTTEGESVLIYSEYDEPFVRLHISDLITGP